MPKALNNLPPSMRNKPAPAPAAEADDKKLEAFIDSAPDSGKASPADEAKPAKRKVSMILDSTLLDWADAEAKRRFQNRTDLVTALLYEAKLKSEQG